MKRLIVDVPNIFYRVVAAHNAKYGGTPEDKANLALHSAVNTMNKWFNTVKPDQLIVAFEGNKNWRKTYTASENCISKVPYKGNRVKDPAMEHLFKVLADFQKLAIENTSIICLTNPVLEGDDLLAGAAIKFANQGDEVVILSGDKDFTQLLKHENISLLEPDKGKFRQCDDPLFFMFEKCIRGDAGDNVRSAFPRVRSTRLEKAFKDPYEMTLLMNEQWTFTNPDTLQETTFTVKDLYEENKLLMDLEAQPDYIKNIIDETIEQALQSHGKFSLFAFQKFLGQHELKQISENVDKFVKMLSCNPSVSAPKKVGALVF